MSRRIEEMSGRPWRDTRRRTPGPRRRPNRTAALAERLESRTLLSVADLIGPRQTVPLSVPGEVLVQFKPGVGDDARAQVRGLAGAKLADRIDDDFTVDPGRGALEKITLPVGGDLQAALKTLQADPSVAYAEPNWIYTAQFDPTYSSGNLWGMYGANTTPANTYGSGAGAAWAAGNTGSKNIYVAVIDEGIQTTHPDLNANVWNNPYDPVNGVDDDGNGFADDTNGWDFANNDRTVYDGGSDGSQDWHGTHVAGTIGAERDGVGVVGVNWDVTMISAKFLGPNGGSLDNAVRALDYVVDLKTRHGLNIVATNNSWGGGGYSQALYDAIQRSGNAGILFVAAAGNASSNNDGSPAYPASYDLPSILSVAAIDSAGRLASFSNYGKNSVDIAAPGVNINSTFPVATYGALSGTSMATPHVTGAAALFASKYLAERGTLPSPALMKESLLGSAIPTGSVSGLVLSGGRLNIPGALAYDPSNPPPAPGNFKGTVIGPGRVRLSWDDTSLLEQGFDLEVSTDGGNSYGAVITLPADTTSYTMNNAPSGVALTFRIRAFKTLDGNRLNSPWVLSAEVVTPTKVSSPYTDPFDTSPLAVGSPWAFTTAGEWSYSAAKNPSLSQPVTTNTNIERKAVLVGLDGVADEIKSRVRLDSWKQGEYAVAGVGLHTDLANGQGYSLVVTGRYGAPKLEFLNDRVAWSSWYDAASSVSLNVKVGSWYWFSMREQNGVLYGKAWADGTAEPGKWTITFNAGAAGWNREGGYASVYGGYAGTYGGTRSYASASFDDVTVKAPPPPRIVSSPYTERFDEDPLASGSVWAFTNPADWAYESKNGALDQPTTNDVYLERKAMLVGLDGTATSIRAKVRINAWDEGEYALAGVGLFTDRTTGQGLNLVVTGRHNDGTKRVEFLNDRVAWSGWDPPFGAGISAPYAMNIGDWHWFELKYDNGVITGKVWADGSPEPSSPTIRLDTQSVWGFNRPVAGFAALNGSYAGTDWNGRSYATSTFDDVTVSTGPLPPLSLPKLASSGPQAGETTPKGLIPLAPVVAPLPPAFEETALTELAREVARSRRKR